MQEQENTFQPAERFILTSVGAVKAFSDSLRLRMLETLMDAPHTVKELARLLDVPQKKLYYQMNVLEKAGLVRMVGTRIVSGIVEKHYRSVARHFVLEQAHIAIEAPLTPQDIQEGIEGLLTLFTHKLVTGVREGVQSGAIDLLQDEKHLNSLLLYRTMASLSPEQAKSFYSRLLALYREFKEYELHPTGTLDYAIALVFHPISPSTSLQAKNDVEIDTQES